MALVVVVSKFTEGAWIPAVLIPALVVGFRAIAKHYRHVSEAVHDHRAVHATSARPTS